MNFAFLGQFADTPRDTVFTTEYSVRTAMEAVYGLLGVDRGVPEVWGSVYDIRELLHSNVCLMDGRSPLEVSLPGPLELLKKPLLKAVRGTVIEKVLRGSGRASGRHVTVGFLPFCVLKNEETTVTQNTFIPNRASFSRLSPVMRLKH